MNETFAKIYALYGRIFKKEILYGGYAMKICLIQTNLG